MWNYFVPSEIAVPIKKKGPRPLTIFCSALLEGYLVEIDSFASAESLPLLSVLHFLSEND